jgi:hypothetical protein
MTTIGTASDHGLTRLATGCLELAAPPADFSSRRAFGFHGICLRFARLVADSFLCMRKRDECKNEYDRSDNFSHDLPSMSGWH